MMLSEAQEEQPTRTMKSATRKLSWSKPRKMKKLPRRNSNSSRDSRMKSTKRKRLSLLFRSAIIETKKPRHKIFNWTMSMLSLVVEHCSKMLSSVWPTAESTVWSVETVLVRLASWTHLPVVNSKACPCTCKFYLSNRKWKAIISRLFS